MRSFAICALLLLCLGGSNALQLDPKNMTRQKCRVLCQRFGMKMLGEQFVGLHPTDCMAKCNEVYPAPAFLQAQPAPAAPAIVAKGKPAQSGAPAAIKR